MTPYLQDPDVTLYHGDALDVLRELPDESVHCIATSPPFYALRDYGTGRWEGGDLEHEHDRVGARGGRGGSGTLDKRSGDAMPATLPAGTCSCGAVYRDPQIGLEETPQLWADSLVAVFREARRVLRKDGTLWVECGDSYSGAGYSNHENTGGAQREDGGKQKHLLSSRSGVKPKDLLGTPWLLAFALRADGWWLRGCNIWAKPNAMPESAKDRCTTAHSYVFQLSKSARYFFDQEAVLERYINAERQATRSDPEPYGRGQASVGGRPASGLRARGPDGRRKTTVQGADGSIQHRDGERWPNGGKHPRSVWTIPTQGYPEAHFATWPEALARRIILAGCPEAVCQECGLVIGSSYNKTHELEHHYMRGVRQGSDGREPNDSTSEVLQSGLLESVELSQPRDDERLRDGSEGLPLVAYAEPPTSGQDGLHHGAPLRDGAGARQVTAEGRDRPSPERDQGRQSAREPSGDAKAQTRSDETSSDQADHLSSLRGRDHHVGTCPACGGRTEPGRVLDPFVGSGTTCFVARKHGRRSIGIDLSAEYLDLAAKRLQQQSLFA